MPVPADPRGLRAPGVWGPGAGRQGEPGGHELASRRGWPVLTVRHPAGPGRGRTGGRGGRARAPGAAGGGGRRRRGGGRGGIRTARPWVRPRREARAPWRTAQPGVCAASACVWGRGVATPSLSGREPPLLLGALGSRPDSCGRAFPPRWTASFAMCHLWALDAGGSLSSPVCEMG